MVKEKFEEVEDVVKKEEEEDVEEKGCRRWRKVEEKPIYASSQDPETPSYLYQKSGQGVLFLYVI